jgi:hypothetical protein
MARTLGEYIRIRMSKVGISTVDELARRAEQTKQTAYNFLNAASPADLERQRVHTKEMIATALRFSIWGNLVDAWTRDDIFFALHQAGGESGIAAVPDNAVPTIPEWTVTASASVWTYVPICRLDSNDPEQAAVIKFGRFRLRIDGRCMEPDYPSGSLVEFEIVRWDEQALRINSDYVFCRNDETATFKKLVAKSDDDLSLAAINQDEFPGVFVVPQQEICRVARAVHILTEPPEPHPLRIRPR